MYGYIMVVVCQARAFQLAAHSDSRSEPSCHGSHKYTKSIFSKAMQRAKIEVNRVEDHATQHSWYNIDMVSSEMDKLHTKPLKLDDTYLLDPLIDAQSYEEMPDVDALPELELLASEKIAAGVLDMYANRALMPGIIAHHRSSNCSGKLDEGDEAALKAFCACVGAAYCKNTCTPKGAIGCSCEDGRWRVTSIIITEMHNNCEETLLPFPRLRSLSFNFDGEVSEKWIERVFDKWVEKQTNIIYLNFQYRDLDDQNSGGQIRIPTLPNLQIFYLETVVPIVDLESICNTPSLRALRVTANLPKLPACFGNLSNLRRLDVRGNRFDITQQEALPPELGKLDLIEFIGFAQNGVECPLKGVNCRVAYDNIFSYKPKADEKEFKKDFEKFICEGHCWAYNFSDLSSPVWKWRNMELFWVDQNCLVCDFLHIAATKWPKLRSLDLYQNNFSETLPASLPWPNLTKLQLQVNNFSGDVTPQFFDSIPKNVPANFQFNRHITGCIPEKGRGIAITRTKIRTCKDGNASYSTSMFRRRRRDSTNRSSLLTMQRAKNGSSAA